MHLAAADSVSVMTDDALGQPLSTCSSLLAPLKEINVQHEKAQKGHHALTSTSPDDVLFAGLLLAGFDAERQSRSGPNRNIDRFKSYYGVEPTTVSPILFDLKNEYPDIVLKDVLMTMNWLFFL